MKKINITNEYIVYDNLKQLTNSQQELFKHAIIARDDAYAPYSNFLVGAAILLENGEIITGSNQENAAYPSGLCAERTAIYYAGAKFPNVKIKTLVITAKSNVKKVENPVGPCGACRQAIAEYEIKQKDNITIIFMGETGKIIESNSLKNLLPFGFDKTYL